MSQDSPPEQARFRPIVFLGPSLSLDVARRTLPHANYRPPIQRGDLDDLGAGTLVGIIDGVFEQTLAISPDEIRQAIYRGAVVYGAASMGALRAAEIPSVKGVGRIYEMYRSGAIERDDEVALTFAAETYQPLTIPLINLRYAVERLVRSTTLSREDGHALIEACSRLHFKERTYRAIFNSSELADNRDVDDIIQLLKGFDLKRDDAQFLLETLADLKVAPQAAVNSAPVARPPEPVLSGTRVQASEDSNAPILIWESGDSFDLVDLISFMKLTGVYEPYARSAISRFAVAGAPIRNGSFEAPYDSQDETQASQSLLDATRLVWGWESPEEAHVTMRDLGLGLVDVSSSLKAEVAAKRVVERFAMEDSHVFMKALRSELWLNDLALKQEVMRLGALWFFARRGAEYGPASEEELTDAKRSISRVRRAMQWPAVRADLHLLGMPDEDIDDMVRELALARRAARPVVEAMYRRSSPQRTVTPRAARWRALGLDFERSTKAEGSNRFRLDPSHAVETADQIVKQIGIVRIGMIGELDTLGVHVAQAFGERSGWSVSFSSGKSETREGARMGSIMEEVEIHAQDAFRAPTEMHASFAGPSCEMPLIDPLELGLPYDSRYRDTLEMDWTSCVDLIGCRTVLVPSACFVGERLANDVYYSPRLGGKIFSSSGLGSGFSLAEATVHAACEYIERHAIRLAELELDHPSTVRRAFWFVDLETLPETPRRIVEKYRRAGMCVRILDVTSDISVPTFYVRVFDDPFTTSSSTSSDGFACHPDPEVGITMALLEAAQTKAGVIAGGREDYSLQARSLGRHERPRTMVPEAQVFWFGNDRPVRSFHETEGFVSRDILEELEWIVDRVEEAAFERFLVRDLTVDRIRPARAVRVIIPGLETTNPLFTGTRARATLIRDLLPRRAAITT